MLMTAKNLHTSCCFILAPTVQHDLVNVYLIILCAVSIVHRFAHFI